MREQMSGTQCLSAKFRSPGVGAVVDEQFVMHVQGELGLDILRGPWQTLKPRVARLARQARMKSLAARKEEYRGAAAATPVS